MARIIKPDFPNRSPRRRPASKPVGRDRRRWKRFDRRLVILLVLLGAVAVFRFLPGLDLPHTPVAEAARVSPGTIEVVDGDTVRSGGSVYRLVGYNTPESGRYARCAQERALASKATQRLRQLVDVRDVQLARVACSCPPGTEGTRSCNHGRLCGKLKTKGRDVGAILIAEGLAERYACGSRSCPRRKDWCSG